MTALLDALIDAPPAQTDAAIDSLSPREAEAILYDWSGTWARPEQLPPPGDWRVWLVLAGRGYGKTRVGAEWVREQVKRYPLVNLIGATADDVRQIMVEGESGLLNICPPQERPEYKAAIRRLDWPNGARSLLFTADEPERLRGKQHMKLWCLTADTLVRMADGREERIDAIVPGAMVATSNGPRRVLATASREAPLISVALANGTRLCGSAEHPVATAQGWTELGRLVPGDILYLWSDDGERTSGGTSTATRGSGSFIAIAWSGKRPTAPSQRAIKSTTRTAFPATIASIISCSSARACTAKRIQPSALRRYAGAVDSNLRMHAWGSPLAIAVPAGAKRVKPSGAWWNAPAATVDASSPRTGATTVVSAVSILGRVGRVHNLTVEQPSNFFANGVLTHNCDEVAAWRRPEAYDQAMLGLRLGSNPQAVVTTTPKPVRVLRQLLYANPDDPPAQRRPNPTTAVTRGSTYDNRDNLAPAFFAEIITRYENTRLGRQELLADLLEEADGALWSRKQLDELRVTAAPELVRVVVAVDPAVTSGEDADSTGIVVAGKGVDGHGYVLADRTCRLSPDGWARRAVAAYHEFKADRLVAEVNNGGDLVEATIRTVDRRVSYKAVHASRGKRTRAEPIAALYEQCVAKDTLIETARGAVPVQYVTTADRVWTRRGLRRVLWAGQTGHKTVVTISAGGRRLACTADHPVYVAGRGFIHAECLVPTDDILLLWNDQDNAWNAGPVSGRESAAARVRPATVGLPLASRAVRMWSSTGGAISSRATAIGARAATPAISCSIAPYGNPRAVPFRTDGTSTTSTATRAITVSRTSPRSIPLRTRANIQTTHDMRELWDGIARDRNAWPGGVNENPSRIHASSAARRFCLSLPAFGSVLPGAIRATGIGAVAPPCGPMPVYNLSVEGEPEFFANGILVHNCKIHHVGAFPELEDQQCNYTPDGYDGSPDRVDSLVWTLTELFEHGKPKVY